MAHRASSRRYRKNLFGFGKRTTYSPTLIKQAHEAGRRSGDTKQFGNWWEKQKHEHPPSGSLKRRAEKQYRAGVESLWTERAKETKAESKEKEKETIQDVTDALVGQGVKKSEAARRAKQAYKPGQEFEATFRKAIGPGKTSKMSANPPKQMHLAEVTKYTGTLAGGAVTLRRQTLKQIQKMQKRWGGEIIAAVDSKGKHVSYVLVVKRAPNPAKFDRCVAEVKKSLKAQKRPGNAYAICTAAGTKNPKWRKVDSFKTKPTAEEVAANYKPSKIVHRGKKWIVWTQQPGTSASARARRKVASHARKVRKAPTQKAKNLQPLTGSRGKTVWTARQGKLKAVVTKPLMGSYRVSIMGGPRVMEEHTARKFDEAVAISRLRLADTRMQGGNPQPAVRLHRGISRTFRASKRKNPMDLALKRYEEFHGIPSEEILEFEEKEHHHSAKVGLGQLVSILVTLINGKTVPLNSPGFTEKGFNGRKYWEFDEKTPTIKRVYLTSSEDGKQLFIDGGDQSIPTEALRALGIGKDDEHDHMLIGTIRMVTYRTRKSFEGKGKEEVDFHHKFSKVEPVLLYFPRSSQLKIAGGRYYIAPPAKDLGSVSPGIVG